MKIFIAGNSRSGTTMLSRIMGNHPDVFSFQELHFFDELVPADKYNEKLTVKTATNLFATLCAIQRNGYFGSRVTTPFRHEAETFIKLNPALTYLELFNKFLLTETAKNLKKIPCEKTPQTVFALDEILANYKDAKIIIMVRDPREVLLSQKHKWRRRQLSAGKIPVREAIRARINYHPITISKLWQAVMSTARNYENNDSVLFVKYEDLISKPEKILIDVCKHCKINYQHQMLDIPIIGSSIFSDKISNRGIDSTKLNQWENGGLNNTEIAICQEITGNLMEQYGYIPKSVERKMPLMLWYKISLPIQLATALLFNLKRLKNIRKVVKRFNN